MLNMLLNMLNKKYVNKARLVIKVVEKPATGFYTGLLNCYLGFEITKNSDQKQSQKQNWSSYSVILIEFKLHRKKEEQTIKIILCTIYKTISSTLSAYKGRDDSRVLDAHEKARIASFVNDFKNDNSFQLISEEMLRKSRESKVEVFLN